MNGLYFQGNSICKSDEICLELITYSHWSYLNGYRPIPLAYLQWGNYRTIMRSYMDIMISKFVHAHGTNLAAHYRVEVAALWVLS